MGMQVHFSVDELEDAADSIQWYFKYDSETDTMSVILKTIYGELWVSCDKNRENCWADIGSMSGAQMDLIKFLITNRICFNAS